MLYMDDDTLWTMLMLRLMFGYLCVFNDLCLLMMLSWYVLTLLHDYIRYDDFINTIDDVSLL